MRNIKLVLAYDGTAYHGWQRQEGPCTLQETLEGAIRSLTGEAVACIVSGRTDAGVHALGQVVNFSSNTQHDCQTLRRALNAILPDDLYVLTAEEADGRFHATHSAKRKLYRYCIHDGPVPDPFLRRYVYHSPWPLDQEAMGQAARYLEGRHDFSSFQTAGAARRGSVRTITHIAVFRAGPERIWAGASIGGASQSGVLTPLEAKPTRSGQGASPFVFLEVTADGFLYNMVRAIAGTLIQVGRGYRAADSVGKILAARDRKKGGPTAPAHGLFLVEVEY